MKETERLHHSYVISESCTVEPRQLYYLIVSWWVSEPLIQKKKKSEVWLKLLSCYSLIPVVMSFHFRLTTHNQAWREVCLLPVAMTSISTSLEGLWKYLVILHWHDCSWMLKARSMRDSIDLPWTLHYFCPVPFDGLLLISVFIRRKRSQLYEVLIFDFFSSQLQVQVPVPQTRSPWQNIWQMSMRHIVFCGEEGVFHREGSKAFQLLKGACEPPQVAEQVFFPDAFLCLCGRRGNPRPLKSSLGS